MTELDYSIIARRMKAERIRNKISQKQVADGLGCTVSFVSNVENSRAKLNLRMLAYYAQMCNVSVDSLMTEREDDSESQKLDKELLHVFHGYTAEEQKKIIKILKTWKADNN